MRHKSKRRYKERVYTNYKNSEKYIEHQQLKFIKKQLINNGGNICAICGKPITNMKDCTVDHIKPRCRGGMTTIENCQLAHLKCNAEKGSTYVKM